MNFCKATYYHCIYTGATRVPRDVVKSFFEDARKAAPACAYENTKRLYVTYTDGGRLTLYTLPLFYKKFLPCKAHPAGGVRV